MEEGACGCWFGLAGLAWLPFFLFGCKRLVECGRLRSKIIDFCSLMREARGGFWRCEVEDLLIWSV
jgi:hypothetical protein